MLFIFVTINLFLKSVEFTAKNSSDESIQYQYKLRQDFTAFF